MSLGLVVLEKLFMRTRTPQSDDIKICMKRVYFYYPPSCFNNTLNNICQKISFETYPKLQAPVNIKTLILNLIFFAIP